MIKQNEGPIVLQMSVRRSKDPPHQFFITIEQKPGEIREYKAAMKFMAERTDFAAEWLDEKGYLEEFR